MHSKNGFTLMELTIVLAILAIIAAILIPIFLNTTDRARLRSDIQSAHVIHNAMELYRAERGRAVQGANMNAILGNLRTAGFLNAQSANIQTAEATWETNTQHGVVVNITDSPDGVHRAYNALSEEERKYVVGGRTIEASPTP
ncbi:MAG: prepilin-type N-terminal cleavage/methylation domain-containing protein [Defluviitaleaceae bacterium]|nr:prepilin-type N-terminal cleavage/methylation domain-containing protein [Defluviitaleaceae bacterium]